tara:strand:- start:58798 stop:61923 length:3126 start_codon:yes stop_codon:yes gene_type:complete
VQKQGLIDLFVRHRTAANLLMVSFIIIGVVAFAKLNTQFFPTFSINWVTVSVNWPGAAAEDVDSNVISIVEPEVRFIDGVKRVVSQSSESGGWVAIEFEQSADMQTALADVETAMSQINNLPEGSERPIIQRIYNYETIARLVVSGPFSEGSLKSLAKGIREGLLADGIDKVDLFGSRDEEIWVEVPQGILRQLDITTEYISEKIAESSIDVPSGILPGSNEKQVRSVGLAKSIEELREIEVISSSDGRKTLIGDIANIYDTFDEKGIETIRKNNPAIELHIRRALTSDALDQSSRLDNFLDQLVPTLPPSIQIERYSDTAEMIEDRINLLLRNGASGLALVVAVLFVFLSGRVAFWVAIGIPVSLLATLGVMLAMGQSINMVSLFAIIMALGIIVDDAIVVGEHAVTRREKGDDPVVAATAGAKRMLAPVMAASLTTIAAFAPLLLISDIIGQIIYAIPMVIIAVIIASLFESFLILPGHLRMALKKNPSSENRFARWFNPRFNSFRDNTFDRLVTGCLKWRYLTIACGLGLIIIVFGIISGGRLDFVFFPSPESDTVYANVIFAEGTDRSETRQMIAELERSLLVAESQLGVSPGELVVMSFGQIGQSVGREDNPIKMNGNHIAGMRVELIPSDSRHIRTQQFIKTWRAETRLMSGTESFSIFEEQAGPPGREIDIRITGSDLTSLKMASSEVKELIYRFPGVSNLEDDLPYGKTEMILEVTPRGKALGFSTDSLGQQVRNAFEGTVAKRFPRGDEEVLVSVRLPREEMKESLIKKLYLRSPEGVFVPLSEIVDFREAQGFAQIKREDGLRMVSVIGEIDQSISNTDEILSSAKNSGLHDIALKYNVNITFKGKAEEQANTLADMKIGGMVGLAAIYLILAAVFSSYSIPIFVMAVIPFGAIGAVLGHLVLGHDVTILSMVGLLGLSGIVVNDSIILVRAVQDRVNKGQSLMEALSGGAKDRLRAVILTSVTTIFGLIPLLFETSLQAQFLKPMAVTIVFGLMASTIIVLILVPTLLAIRGDIGWLFSRAKNGEPTIPE